jgi:hypothetical protein
MKATDMADYIATARSNYFAVKNEAAFAAWCERRDLATWTDDQDLSLHAISSDTCHGDWPSYDPDEDGDFDLAQELAAHLAPGHVAVLIEAGAEKLRYVSGSAVAVHPDGRTVQLCLDDIYAMAKAAFGDDLAITQAIT